MVKQLKFGRQLNAFFDGFTTGFDIVGTALGYITGNYQNSSGYLADRYGFKREIEGSTVHSEFHREPIQRGIEEQSWKAAGDVVGLAANVATLGVHQIMGIREYIFKEKIGRAIRRLRVLQL